MKLLKSDSVHQTGVLAVMVASHSLELLPLVQTETVSGGEKDGMLTGGLDHGGAAPQASVHLQPTQPWPGTCNRAPAPLYLGQLCCTTAWTQVTEEEGRGGGRYLCYSSTLQWSDSILVGETLSSDSPLSSSGLEWKILIKFLIVISFSFSQLSYFRVIAVGHQQCVYYYHLWEGVGGYFHPHYWIVVAERISKMLSKQFSANEEEKIEEKKAGILNLILKFYYNKNRHKTLESDLF